MAEKEKDELEKMNEALSMSEQFVEKYQKPLLWGLLIVVVVIGAILGVRHFYLLPREDKAQAAMYQAVMAFETTLSTWQSTVMKNSTASWLSSINMARRLPAIWQTPIWVWPTTKKANMRTPRNTSRNSAPTNRFWLLP